MKIRLLEKEDYHRNFLHLLEQLTIVEAEAGTISYKDFVEQFDNRPNSYTYVIEHSAQIIATTTLVLERKFIHHLSSVGHIEDVVVDQAHRKQGLGKQLLDFVSKKSKEFGCYKVVLHCSLSNTDFYEKLGFTAKGVAMEKRNT